MHSDIFHIIFGNKVLRPIQFILSLDDFYRLMYYCGIGFGENLVSLQANT